MLPAFRKRDIIAAILAALVAGLALTSPPLHLLRGLSLDVLTALRAKLFDDTHGSSTSPVVVIAIDAETYDTPPFRGSPTLTWTREIGRVLTAVVDGGAKVVGFDVIFPSSIEQSEIPFGDSPLGTRMKGFDRDYLIALRQASDAGKLVLGEILGVDRQDVPYRAQQLAVRDNVRALNVYTDSDGVIRRMPLSFSIGTERLPAMAPELAARALGTKAEIAADGTMRIAGYTVPTAVPNTLTLNLRDAGRNIPTFSFADLHACLGRDDGSFFRHAFQGKVVLLGTVLDAADRKLTSARLAGAYDGTSGPRCSLPLRPGPAGTARRDIAGVLVHAAAVRNLIEQDGVREVGVPLRTLITVIFSALVGLAACRLAPGNTVLAYIVLLMFYTAGAASLFAKNIALPLAEPALAALAVAAAMVGFRFVIADREERFLRKSFAYYLAPQVIESMVSSRRMPALGGEMREVTVLFSDLAGFSSIAEKTAPEALVTMLNQYLSEMTDIIESHGGYVDKYIGDSVIAVFGAPAHDPDHARHAVAAALSCGARLRELNVGDSPFAGHELSHRIGLNTGQALVGNIGSRRRFNYTVMSDTVNVASRLEGANKFYETSIMASESTVKQTGESFAWRELDTIKVKGRDEPIKVYEPLGKQDEAGERASLLKTYVEGLSYWRSREFSSAAEAFEGIAESDPPSALFAKRARAFAADPPPPGWVPVHTLEGK